MWISQYNVWFSFCRQTKHSFLLLNFFNRLVTKQKYYNFRSESLFIKHNYFFVTNYFNILTARIWKQKFAYLIYLIKFFDNTIWAFSNIFNIYLQILKFSSHLSNPSKLVKLYNPHDIIKLRAISQRETRDILIFNYDFI